VSAPSVVWNFTLGGIKLTRFEVPAGFDDGVDPHIAVHRYINEQGGAAVKTQSLGAYPLPTKWGAKLFGAGAIARHLQFKALAAAGQPVQLSFGPLSYVVAITHYLGKILHQFQVNYEIDLTVISEKTGALPAQAAVVSFDVGTQAVYDTAAQAMTDLQVADVNLSASITAANTALTTQLQNAYPLKLQPLSTILSILASIALLQSALQAYVTPLEQNAVLEADLMRLDASLRALQGFGLLTTNLQQLLGISPTAQSIILTYGNLYAVAAQYYPGSDVPTIADMLAAANGLSDYWITSSTALVLPPVFN
jgi:hypothetical protein